MPLYFMFVAILLRWVQEMIDRIKRNSCGMDHLSIVRNYTWSPGVKYVGQSIGGTWHPRFKIHEASYCDQMVVAPDRQS